MMAVLRLKRFIKLCVTFLLICGMGSVIAVSSASAEIDERTHWPVEVASDWNSVYGRVSNLILQDGDSVGMFDSKGKCYGAGMVRGGYYFLSAYMLEEANAAIPDDFAIPGFKVGDEVIFKAYKEGIAEEYILTPADNVPYIYTLKGKYPPIRIDLVYAKETEFPTSELGIDPQWLGTADGLYSDLDSDLDQDVLEWPAEEDEFALEEPEKIEEFSEKPEIAEEEISPREYEREISRIGDKEEFDMDLYEPRDYYERAISSRIDRPSSRTTDRPSEHTAQGGISKLSLPASKEEQGGDEIIASVEDVITEAPQAETTLHEMKPLKEDRLPLIALIASICAGFVCIAIIIYDRKPYTVNQI